MQFKRVLSVKDAKGVLARSQGRRGRRRRRVSCKGTHASGTRLATFLLKYFAVWALGTGDRGRGGAKERGSGSWKWATGHKRPTGAGPEVKDSE